MNITGEGGQGIDELFMVLLRHQGEGYLLANAQSGALMIWDTYWGVVQALSKVEKYLGPLEPEIIRVTSTTHPGVKDMYLNDFMLEVCSVESTSDIRLKEITGLGLVFPVIEEKAMKYRLIVEG